MFSLSNFVIEFEMWRPWEQCAARFQENSDDLEENVEENGAQRHYTHLPLEAKQIVLNVFQAISQENGAAGAIAKTSEYTKVPYSTVYHIVKNGIRERKPRDSTGTSKVVPVGIHELIRRAIYDFYKRNKVCSIRELHGYLKTTTNLNCCEETLRKVVHKIGFKRKRLDKREVIKESAHIVRWKYDYLRTIEDYRKNGRPIIYLDETWYDTHDTRNKGWVDDSNSCKLDVPHNRGKRIIILHAGWEQGFINNALLLSAKNVKDARLDYHSDMSAELFERWFKEQLLPNVPPNSIIVMDNASYHSRQIEKIPSSASNKTEIMEFLYKEHLYFEENYTKKELLEVLKTKQFKKRFVIDDLARLNGHEVLRLPPYHCEFNPIELIWAQLKRNVRKNNTSPKFSSNTITLIREEARKIPISSWKKCVNHVIKVEEFFRKQLVPELIISVNEDSSDDEDILEEDNVSSAKRFGWLAFRNTLTTI